MHEENGLKTQPEHNGSGLTTAAAALFEAQQNEGLPTPAAERAREGQAEKAPQVSTILPSQSRHYTSR